MGRAGVRGNAGARGLDRLRRRRARGLRSGARSEQRHDVDRSAHESRPLGGFRLLGVADAARSVELSAPLVAAVPTEASANPERIISQNRMIAGNASTVVS